MVKHGSLFSGIGGFDLGFERAGMITAWQVEIDELKRKVLSKNFPNVPKFSDIKNCGSHNLDKVNVISGGSPCQGFSTNGGEISELYGTQSELIFDFGRIANELLPEWIVIENVKNILKWSNVISDIFGKWCLYDKTIKASTLGAYTRRERVFIVGHLRTSGGYNIFDKAITDTTYFETRQRRDNLPMCLTWGGGLNLERLGSTIVSTKTYTIRVRESNGISGRMDKYRWDWLGNAVAVPVAEWIGKRIMECSR